MSDWFYATDSTGNTSYINWTLVRQIDVTHDTIRLIFSPDHILIFQGKAMEQLKAVCRERGVY